MPNPFRSLIRTIAFFDKEIVEILRQPRLIWMLIFGPFIVLVLFGFGYRNEEQPLRAVFVAAKNDPFAAEMYRFAMGISPQLVFIGAVDQEERARQLLRSKQVDLIVIAPKNAEDAISKNEHATFTLLHDQVDPKLSESIRLRGELYIDKLNQSLLDSAEEGSRRQLLADIKECEDTVHELRKGLERGDLEAARVEQSRFDLELKHLNSSIRSRVEWLNTEHRDQLSEILTNLSGIHDITATSLVPDKTKRSYAEDADRASKVETALIVLGSQLSDLKGPDMSLVLSPFVTEVRGLRQAQPKLAQFFSPGLIILLLQHLAITFAALALIREFKGGNAEVFRVSPLRIGELLLGKYLGYLVICGFVAALLTVLIVRGFRVPMMGQWPQYLAVIAAMLFASLSIGFVISTLSNSEEQAVQYCMFFFIASVFFTGFLLNLDLLWGPIRFLSYALPATYGIPLIQDVMLRGSNAPPFPLAMLGVLGLMICIAATGLAHRRMSHVS